MNVHVTAWTGAKVKIAGRIRYCLLVKFRKSAKIGTNSFGFHINLQHAYFKVAVFTAVTVTSSIVVHRGTHPRLPTLKWMAPSPGESSPVSKLSHTVIYGVVWHLKMTDYHIYNRWWSKRSECTVGLFWLSHQFSWASYQFTLMGFTFQSVMFRTAG